MNKVPLSNKTLKPESLTQLETASLNERNRPYLLVVNTMKYSVAPLKWRLVCTHNDAFLCNLDLIPDPRKECVACISQVSWIWQLLDDHTNKIYFSSFHTWLDLATGFSNLTSTISVYANYIHKSISIIGTNFIFFTHGNIIPPAIG